jgi:hypothetical protein
MQKGGEAKRGEPIGPMRNLLGKSSAAQCLDEEPSDGETAYPRAKEVNGLFFRTQACGMRPGLVQARVSDEASRK